MDRLQQSPDSAIDHVPGLLKALIWPAVASAAGSAATASSVNSWYRTLDKPSFNPPSGVFGPVWTTLYIMMGIADYIVAQKGDTKQVENTRAIYRLQLALNAGWSVIFFGLRKPMVALVEIVVLWVAIVMTIMAFARISKVAAMLLVPYLLWTTFAIALNAGIVAKNR